MALLDLGSLLYKFCFLPFMYQLTTFLGLGLGHVICFG